MTQSEIANGSASVAAIASPLWLPSLHTVSALAAEWLPILGVICLCLQSALWLLRLWRTYHKELR